MVGNNRIIGGTVVGDEEGPASPVAVVLITAVEKIAVEEESITCLHFYLDQGKPLWWYNMVLT